jgi:hypothetical protein
MLMKVFLWAAGLTLFFWATARLMENRMTFYPFTELAAEPSQMGIEFDDVHFESVDGITLHGWHCRPPRDTAHRFDLLFLHGNGGNISHRLLNLKGLTDSGIGVFIFDYRGYGRSGGKPDEAGILEDSRAAYDLFRGRYTESGRPWGIFGRSLGSLLAVRLAVEGETVPFLILEGSFPSKRAFVIRYPIFWPFLPFVSRVLDISGILDSVSCPTLIMHARKDEVIPFSLGRKVFQGMKDRAQFYEITAGGHNDAFVMEENYYPRILRFLEEIPPG